MGFLIKPAAFGALILAGCLLRVAAGSAGLSWLSSRSALDEAWVSSRVEGWLLTLSASTGEFFESRANNKRGNVVKVKSGDSVQLMQV